MESKNKIITQTLPLHPVFNLNEYYGDGENFEFEKDVIYIDNRESEDTLTIFREYIQDNTIKFKDGKHKGSNKHFNGYYILCISSLICRQPYERCNGDGNGGHPRRGDGFSCLSGSCESG